MGGVDDGLVVGDQVVLVAVQVGDPAQRLARRGDVVAVGAEHHDRRAYVAQVHAHAVGGQQLGGGQLVADEQVVDDVLHLHVVEEDVAAPVLLEAQVAVGLGVDVGVQVVLLLPQGVGRVQVLEVLHQPGAVEAPGADVAGQCGQPAAAGQAAAVAHRVVAGPVRDRRAGQDDRPEQLRPDRRGHQHLPAGLAVADHHGLAVARMQFADLAHERGLGAHHVLDRLPRHRVGQEADEVARMTGLHRRTDLAVGLEATDARAVAGARVDHDEGALGRVDRGSGAGHDARQPVVDRARQVQAGEHQFGLEVEHVGHALAQVRLVLVAALAEYVGIQQAALPGVDGVFGRGGTQPQRVGRPVCGDVPGRLVGGAIVAHVVGACVGISVRWRWPRPGHRRCTAWPGPCGHRGGSVRGPG